MADAIRACRLWTQSQPISPTIATMRRGLPANIGARCGNVAGRLHPFADGNVAPLHGLQEAPMKSFALAVTLSALACVPATAAPKHHRHHHVSQAAAHSYAAQPQIACTVVGSAPVPRGCHPEMGYTPDGTPTGFDVAVCGSGAYTLYGNRR
jgi:hypothetical protein